MVIYFKCQPFLKKLTIFLDPGGCCVLGHNHLTELVSYEAEDVLGCVLVQLGVLQPGDPQGQGLVIKLLRVGEAIHPEDSIFTEGQPGGVKQDTITQCVQQRMKIEKK